MPMPGRCNEKRAMIEDGVVVIVVVADGTDGFLARRESKRASE